MSPRPRLHTRSGRPRYTPGGALAQRDVSGNIRAFLKDPHGDAIGLSGTSGSAAATPTEALSYSPFGEQRAQTGESSSLGFQGQFTDAATSFVDTTTRWYDPSQGRFTTQDVLFGDPTHPPSLNQYAYGADNPASLSDPTGMYPGLAPRSWSRTGWWGFFFGHVLSWLPTLQCSATQETCVTPGSQAWPVPFELAAPPVVLPPAEPVPPLLSSLPGWAPPPPPGIRIEWKPVLPDSAYPAVAPQRVSFDAAYEFVNPVCSGAGLAGGTVVGAACNVIGAGPTYDHYLKKGLSPHDARNAATIETGGNLVITAGAGACTAISGGAGAVPCAVGGAVVGFGWSAVMGVVTTPTYAPGVCPPGAVRQYPVPATGDSAAAAAAAGYSEGMGPCPG